MHMLGYPWLKSPLTALPLSSNEPGCRYLGQLSIKWSWSQRTRETYKPAAYKVSAFNETHRISTLSVATITIKKRTVVVNNYYEIQSHVRGTTN